MSKKKLFLTGSVVMLALLMFQIYSLMNFDQFKAEGGLKMEGRIEYNDVLKKYRRASLDFDYVLKDASRKHQQKGGDFLKIWAESNKKHLNKPLVYQLNYKEISALSINSKDEEVIEFLRENLKTSTERTGAVYAQRLEGLHGVQLMVSSDLEELIMTFKIPGQTKKIDSDQLRLPSMHVSFYECLGFNQLGGLWQSACELSNQDSTNEDEETAQEWKLTGANKTPIDLAQSLANTVRWEGSAGVVLDKDKLFVDETLRSPEVAILFPKTIRFLWSQKTNLPGTGYVWNLYAVLIPEDGRAKISEYDIQSAKLSLDQQTQQQALEISMTHDGADKWAKMTEENVGREIAMCVNGVVFSAPRVEGPITGGRTQIIGKDSQVMKDLELVLNSRALEVVPVDFKESFVKPNPPMFSALLQQLLITVSSILLIVFTLGYVRNFRVD